MGLSRTFLRQTAISVENRKIFPPLCILCPRWKGSPCKWVLALGVKKTTVMGADKEVWRYFSHVHRMHQRDRQTDGHRATAKTMLVRVCILWYTTTCSQSGTDNHSCYPPHNHHWTEVKWKDRVTQLNLTAVIMVMTVVKHSHHDLSIL